MANSNGETILHQLKKEVCLDKKSLIDLYMELDEEKSASAVAANDAIGSQGYKPKNPLFKWRLCSTKE